MMLKCELLGCARRIDWTAMTFLCQYCCLLLRCLHSYPMVDNASPQDPGVGQGLGKGCLQLSQLSGLSCPA